ncbi:pH-sensitive chloride channel 2-like [Bactrocera tryoni]|uniref:pH-sensitive chloride channel 2-like n=1 Tax=Bactrocera tryoni TaxID=59916 RepID=UPI001A982097|nr:pH-sensitive chloride channel 2-like [Bactrocera tryoni]
MKFPLVLLHYLIICLTLVLAAVVPEECVKTSNEAISMHINSSTTKTQTTTSCAALDNADSLTQTQLIFRLTNPCRFDRFDRPFPVLEKNSVADQPSNIYVRIYITDIQIIDTNDMQCKIFGFLQLRYMDHRLAFGEYAPKRLQPILGDSQLLDRIWVPHIIFANKQNTAILETSEKDILIMVMPDGVLSISARIEASLSCSVALNKFPFDDQQCSAIIESWLYNSSEVILHWGEEDAIEIDPNIQLIDYELEYSWHNETIFQTRKGDLRYTLLGGNYSSISFTVYLTRDSLFYTFDYFLPSIMLVGISWVSFWLQADQTPARTTLGTSTMLSLFTLTSNYEKKFETKNHAQFFEVWFFGCTFFIFGSLMEFAFVNTIWRRNKCLSLKKVNSKYIFKSTLSPKVIPQSKIYDCETDGRIHFINGNICNQSKNKGHITVLEADANLSAEHQEKKTSNDSWATMTPHEVSLWVDRKARFVFPLLFIIFNAIYWTFVYCL